MASVAVELAPPLIRSALLTERSFREGYGFKTEAVINFGSTGFAVQRSGLFNAVRRVLAGEVAVELTDVNDRTWDLRNEARSAEAPTLVLSSGQKRLVLPDFCILSEEAETRIRSLNESASDVNLPLIDRNGWLEILRERPLKDDEVDSFLSDIRDTPVHVEQRIRSEILAGQSSLSTLVPTSRRYFNRLVGMYDGSGSIRDYAIGPGRQLLKQVSDWRPYEGFLFSLLLSSHSSMTSEISIDCLTPEELGRALEYLAQHGDMLSRLGAFEVGLRVLPGRPEIEPFLLRLVHRIRDDDAECETSEFKLFSALFVLVDGELARTRIMAKEPPYYRRQASLAQAALIHRQILKCEIDRGHFSEWAFSSRGEHFYMQSLSDMRAEPRWNPDMATAPQLKAEFFGRIIIAGNKLHANLGNDELRTTILGEEKHSLRKLCEFPHPYLPGPLEGQVENSNALPGCLAKVIEEQLASDEVGAASFIALVNSALIFSVSSGHAELAVKALKFGNYTLAKLENKSQLVGILNGLATVAAVSRNPGLAEELRILVRRYRRDPQHGLSVEEIMKVCLVASAAREDLLEWRRFAGEWLTELAFFDFEENEGEVLHSHLLTLLHSVPELWVSCARADAALRAWCFR